ncbi:glycosyltransferase family 4 protein, partial [Candidatus Woesearchaeota archaeon]|nr:glycosyltransferase family 4 protein [Candidatus Woesearchaeota archaeon]
MRILMICEFSAGSCGVWNRVFNIGKSLVKLGHEVHIFSSNRVKGTKEVAQENEVLEGVNIKRFPVRFSLGENALFWKFKKELFELKPDIIDAHVYRHPHSTVIPKYARELNIPCILTTHAPFVERELRSAPLNVGVWLYDKLLAKKIWNSYTKIVAISQWEFPHLEKLGCDKEKLAYISNGVPDEFFKTEPSQKRTDIVLFLGRVAPIKDLETLIKAAKIVNRDYKKAKFFIVGPAEESYIKKLKKLIKELVLDEVVLFAKQVTDLEKKIKLINSCDLFVLPSKREGIPQVLIEAMSLGRIVITSKTRGGEELVDESRGMLFDVGNYEELAGKIVYALEAYNELGDLRERARLFAKEFAMCTIVKKTENLYKQAIA